MILDSTFLFGFSNTRSYILKIFKEYGINYYHNRNISEFENMKTLNNRSLKFEMLKIGVNQIQSVFESILKSFSDCIFAKPTLAASENEL